MYVYICICMYIYIYICICLPQQVGSLPLTPPVKPICIYVCVCVLIHTDDLVNNKLVYLFLNKK